MNRRRGSVTKNLRDYIVPIIGFVLILILIFSVFSGGDDNNAKIDNENKTGLSLELGSDTSEGTISYPGDYKSKIEGNTNLYKGEEVIVKSGNITLEYPGVATFNVNKLGEFKFKENGNFNLSSGDLWIDSKTKINLDMDFAGVKLGENSHASFSQNEMGSTIYLLSGFAEVSNLVGQSTVLAPGEKVTVSRVEASKDDLDLKLAKEELDDYFTRSEWFIKNNGSFFLNSSNDEEEDETSTGTTSFISNSNSLITFNNLEDESNVSSDTIDINGNFLDSSITKVVLNGEEAEMNTENKTFSFEGVNVSKEVNDLVFRVYDDANDILTKFVYVVYYSNGSSSNSNSGGFNVKTFDVDGSQFTFTSIKDGVLKSLYGKTTYTTYGDFLTIYGSVKAEGIANVSINGYTLKSFNGSSWRYHPSIVNNNLSVGTNVYEVKYFDAEGKLIYTNHFTIIKKDGTAPVLNNTTTTVEKETEKVSGEASVN